MSFEFLSGGGEAGALMRAMDWSQTGLGPVERWPQSLRTSVSTCLNSRFPILVWWGPELIKIYNDAYRQILGNKHPRAMGQRGRECWPEIWHIIGPMLEGVLERGEATWSENQLLMLERRGFPEECYFTFSYSPIRDETGIAGVFCAVTETTGHLLGERRLRTLRNLAAHAGALAGEQQAWQGAISVIAENPHDMPFALLYRADEDGTSAKLVGAAGAGERPAACLQVGADGAPAGRREGRPAEVLPISRAGSSPYGWLIAGLSANRAYDDEYKGFLALVADHVAAGVANARSYEEEKKRAEALAELDRAKTAFFSNVSHEFRTPLTLMLGPVEDALADAEQPLAPDQRERLELARRSGLRLQKLVNTLLDFSRIEAGRAQASYVPTDLAGFTRDVASNFRSAIEKAGLKLIIACPPGAEPAYVDRDMWEKIVLNLLSNAFKFTFEGEIEVSLRQTARRIDLAVRDTGTGIPAAELPHMFERFRRVAGARSRTHEGTGIGLALVQELVKLHGGSVSVESLEGRGSTFTVSIPADKAHLPAERLGAARTLSSTALGAAPFAEEALRWLPHAEPLTRSSLEEAVPSCGAVRARIVWVDDNADMREYVRRLLGTRYEVQALADGQAALEAVRDQRPDLVLADVMMPKLDGLSLARALRADPKTCGIPVILLSARAGEEARIGGLDAGADDYLYKPFSARELLARVSARLQLSRLQARLDQQRADLASLFAQTPVPTAVLRGEELVFEMANPAYRQVVGGRELVGKPLLDALPEARGQGFDDLLRKVLRTGVPHIGRETRVRLARHGGIEDLYFTFIYAPLRGDGGAVERVIAIVNEVTDQVRAREKIRESDERLRLAMAAGLMGAWDMDLATGMVTWDAKQCELFGRAADEPVRTMDEFYAAVHPDDVERVKQAAADAERTGRFFLEFRVVRPGGEVSWIAGTGATVTDPHGRPVRMVGLNYDVTARKRTEEVLRDADRRKDEFLAMLSHELRNPLSSIRNAVSLLRDGPRDSVVQRQACAILDRQVNNLIRLVDDLLDISRVTLGRIDLRKELLELSPIVETAVETSRPLIEAAGHRLEVSLPPEPVLVLADRVRLAQVISNLLNNAAKYTPACGHIEVLGRVEADSVVLCVRDNGLGIPADSLARLFEMFTRLEAARRKVPGGLGIGLALARQLVQLHGGSIEARSEGPGRGSELIVRLPRVTSSAPIVLPGAQPVRAVGGGRRVLIVDDNVDAARSLGMLVEQMGHAVRLSYGGRAALEAARMDPPELVLLDIDMPDFDGLALAVKLRQDPRFDGVRIVAVTGLGQEGDRKRARDAGFDEHLIKPVDAGVLRSTLELIQWKNKTALP